MDSSLSGIIDEQNEHPFGFPDFSAFSDGPLSFNPIYDMSTAAFPFTFDPRRQENDNAALADRAAAELQRDTMNTELELMAGLSSYSSSPSSYSPETLSPGSPPDFEVMQSFTPSPSAFKLGGHHTIYTNLLHSQQWADFSVSGLDEDLQRPSIPSQSNPVALSDNSLHLLMVPPSLQEFGSKVLSSGFDFNPQLNQPLPSYPSPGSIPTRHLEFPAAPNPSQPEQFYPTPTSTPQRALTSLPHQSAQEVELYDPPQPPSPLARATRPVRAAAAAAKRKVSCVDNDDDSDEYQPVPKRRKASSSACAMRSSVTPHRSTDKRNSKKQQNKNQKDTKAVWEEDKTVDSSTPVHLNGKILEGCQWGVPVYAICPAEGLRSIKWRCTSCSALLGRRPDLHRHWKSCVENAIFVCDEVIHEDGNVWPGCGTICSRQDAARRHIERRFRNGHCSLTKPNENSFTTTAAYEQRLAVYNNMLVNSTWRAALPACEKNRLAHSALPGMKTDIFKE